MKSPESVGGLSSPESPKKLTMAERHPDWPKLNVHFWLSAHNNAQDMQGLEPLFNEVNIFL